ncbi:hypothetical protein, partial [Vibrio sp. TRT 17S01]|uniref:hypothetical protein n=1 Tax=Vibrio sp. TRT 17S01 TaxID=3418505 RepID=UPI003CEE59F0
MNSNPFPFVAGQRTDKAFASSYVLSPFPIKTLLPKPRQCDQLVKKTKQYIDLGGASGMIFQTQLMWVSFLIVFFVFIFSYIAFGGFSGMYELSFKEELVNGQWAKKLNLFDFFSALFVMFVPLLVNILINLKIAQSARETLSQSLPCRFHRQRREVLFSR